jgi:ribosomal protein L40E
MKLKVEILQGEPKPDLTLEPFFRSREETKLIRLLQSVAAVRKYAVVFEKHGCIRCGNRVLPHASCSMCAKCRRWFYNELKTAEKQIAKGEV